MDDMSKQPIKAKQGRKPRQKKEETTSKIKEVQTNPVESEVRERPTIVNTREYDVIVNGVDRKLSKPSIEVLQRDPKNFNLEFPKGSKFAEPVVDEPCKNC